jgi:hypothetical protein
MHITRSTLLIAFAHILDDRIDPGMLLCRSDLVEDWATTGLRTGDLEGVLESLHAAGHLDRTQSDTETWYRVTTSGAIELRICRNNFWQRLRDRFNLLRARLRLSAPRRRHALLAERRSDRVANERG